MTRGAAALALIAVLASRSGEATRTSSASSSPLAAPVPAASTPATAPSITVPPASAPAATWAVACGTVSDYVGTTTTTNGSLVLDSPGRTPLKITLTLARWSPGGGVSGYICAALEAGVPDPIFAGLSAPGAPGYIAPTVYPATMAKPAPPDFVVPQSCAFVRPPEVGTDQSSWWVDCGAELNRNARGTLGTAFRQQGWTDCGPALGTMLFYKGTVRITVVESSLAPGDYPRFSQQMRPGTGCG